MKMRKDPAGRRVAPVMNPTPGIKIKTPKVPSVPKPDASFLKHTITDN